MQPAIHGIVAPGEAKLEYHLDMNQPCRVYKPSRSHWLWIASIWLGIALFSSVQNLLMMRVEGMAHAWTRLFITLLLSWLVWVAATPFVLRLGRLYPLRMRPDSTWLIHIGVCSVLGLASSVWEAWLEYALNPLLKVPDAGSFKSLWLETMYSEALLYLSLYAAMLAISYILDSRERLIRHQIETARLNEQFSKAQLDALRRQIEPHFLFNALHAISGLVREKRSEDAVTMISGLSDFLRKVVDVSDRQVVPLREEMQFLQKYLDIQKVRFADRLQLNVDVPDELLASPVPSLILQPIVENAIKHGIAKEARGGWIRVTAFRSNGFLSFRVYNDGAKLATGWESVRSGVGIANLRNRLRMMYGDDFEFSLTNQPAGVEVLMSVPFRER
jgi:two-component system LytT family sensor kinase